LDRPRLPALAGTIGCEPGPGLPAVPPPSVEPPKSATPAGAPRRMCASGARIQHVSEQRPGDHQRTDPARELGVEQQERQSAEMIAVEVRVDDEFDRYSCREHEFP